MGDLTNTLNDASSNEEADVMKKQVEANDKMHKHLSTVFVIVGIVSFTLGAIVNWYTIQRIKGGKI
jgi:hypothetical protein